MPDSDRYDGSEIIKNLWPEWVPDSAGGWSRTWSFVFEQDMPALLLPAGLSDEVVDVAVAAGPSANHLLVKTRTIANRWSDEVFFLSAYRLFERLEQRFGPLVSIEGQPRAHWRPFRSIRPPEHPAGRS